MNFMMTLAAINFCIGNIPGAIFFLVFGIIQKKYGT